MWTLAALVTLGVMTIFLMLSALYRLRIRQKGWGVSVAGAVAAGAVNTVLNYAASSFVKKCAIEFGKDDVAIDILTGVFLVGAGTAMTLMNADAVKRLLPTKRERWLREETARLYNRG